MRFELAMFDFSWSELLLIGIVALVAIGPKELPGALRTLGQWVAKVRRMAAEFQNQFHEAMREAELAELKKEVDEMTVKAQSYANFDPVETIRSDLEKAASPPPELDAPLSSVPAASTGTPGEGGYQPAQAVPEPPAAAPAASAPAAEPAAQNEPHHAPANTAAPGQISEPAKTDPPKPDAGRAA